MRGGHGGCRREEDLAEKGRGCIRAHRRQSTVTHGGIEDSSEDVGAIGEWRDVVEFALGHVLPYGGWSRLGGCRHGECWWRRRLDHAMGCHGAAAVQWGTAARERRFEWSSAWLEEVARDVQRGDIELGQGTVVGWCLQRLHARAPGLAWSREGGKEGLWFCWLGDGRKRRLLLV